MGFPIRRWLVGPSLALWLAPLDAAAGAEERGKPELSTDDRSGAQSSGAAGVKAARERYREGARAYAAGRYKEAIDLFRDAARIAPNPAFSYNIGLAYEHLGDQANALKWYRDYLRREPDASDRAEVETRIESAEEYLRERGVQQVTILSVPDGATVAVDGEPVGVTPWTGEFVPGEHHVVLMRRGYRDAEKAVTLPPDEATDIVLTLQRTKPAPVEENPNSPAAKPGSAPISSSTDSDGGREESKVKPMTWGFLGVGVAGLATSLGLEVARSNAEDRARDDERTQVERKVDFDRAQSLQTVARVMVGVGAAATSVGAVLLYLDLNSEEPGAVAHGLSLGCSVASCDVQLQGSFE